MKPSKVFKNRLFFTLLFCCLFTVPAFSQACDPMFDPFCEDVDMPLDDYVIVLMVILAIISYFIVAKKKNSVASV